MNPALKDESSRVGNRAGLGARVKVPPRGRSLSRSTQHHRSTNKEQHMPEEKPTTTTTVSQDAATREAMKKIARVLEALPTDQSRQRVIRATAVLLDIPLG